MSPADLVLDFLAIHLGVGKVAEDAPEVLAVNVASVIRVIEGEGILDLIFLHRANDTISSVSLLLVLAFLPPLAFDTFFLSPFISYKIIVSKTIPTKIISITLPQYHLRALPFKLVNFRPTHGIGGGYLTLEVRLILNLNLPYEP